MLSIIVLVAGFYGLIVGSAVNAVVWRVHEQRSWARGRSMCPKCHHHLGALDLVPVLSWLLLRGRCRYCHKPISWQYPAVELLIAALYALSAYIVQPSGVVGWIEFAMWLVLLAILVALAVYDLRWMLLPDRLTYPAAVVAAVMAFTEMISSVSFTALMNPLAAGLGAAIMFYLIAAATRGKGMGGGDIKLVFVMGLVLGLPKMALALFLAFNSGAIIGLILLASRRLKSHLLPFGPFLIGSTVVAYLYGERLIEAYLRLSGVSS